MLLSLLLSRLFIDPLDRVSHAAIALGDEILVVGGYSNGSREFLSSVTKWSTKTGLFTPLPPIPEPKAFAAYAVMDSKLYLIGGLTTDSAPTKTTYIFDLKTKKWTSGPDYPTTISRAAAQRIGSSIVITGGIIGPDTASKNSASTWIFSPNTEEWKKGRNLPYALHGHATVVIGEVMYIVGGYAGSGMDQTPQVLTGNGVDLWQQAPVLPEPRGFANAIVFQDQLYVFGNRGPSSHPLRLDTRSSKWYALKISDTPRHRSTPVLIGNNLWLIGGESASGSFEKFDLASFVGR